MYYYIAITFMLATGDVPIRENPEILYPSLRQCNEALFNKMYRMRHVNVDWRMTCKKRGSKDV